MNISNAQPEGKQVAELPTYREIPGWRPENRDVLKQLQSNVQTLEDLTGRLSFLLSEVRTLVRR